MAKKLVHFSVNQLIINGQTPFSLSSFDCVDKETLEVEKSTNREGEKEIITIKRVDKEIIEDRFITFLFDGGSKYPYSSKVIDSSFKEQDNPRPSDKIEIDEQFFVLIDILTQRVFVSDQRKKQTFNFWLAKKIAMDVFIKAIIEERDFINKIKSISKISFTVEPNLFNSSSQDFLSNNLVRDIYGFGAKTAQINFDYNNSHISDTIVEKFNALFRRKNEFVNLVIVGRSDDNLENILNLNEIVSSITINVSTDEKSGLLNSISVFNSLINEIKK